MSGTYNQVSQQDSNGDLADGWHVDGGLFLDGGAVKVSVRGEVDADGTVADKFGRNLERLNGDTPNDNITEGKAVLQLPALLVGDKVAGLLDTLSSGEDLDTGDIHGVDGGSVVGEQSSKRSAVDLRSVDDGDGLAEESVTRSQDRVVDLQVLKDLDYSERSARKDGLLAVLGRVNKADVVVHVVDVLVSKTLDVLAEIDRLLDVLVVGRVVGEDGIVDDHAVDILIFIGLHDLLLEELLVHSSEVKVEAAMAYISARPGGSHHPIDRAIFKLHRGISHFSSHVFFDHSAYLTAAGSPLARKAASVGVKGFSPWILASVSLTSPRKPLAMVSAVMTLQVLGTFEEAIAKVLKFRLRLRRQVFI